MLAGVPPSSPSLPRLIASQVFATVVQYRMGHHGRRPDLLVLAALAVYEQLERLVPPNGLAGWAWHGWSMRVCGYPVVLDAVGELTADEPGWRIEITGEQ